MNKLSLTALSSALMFSLLLAPATPSFADTDTWADVGKVLTGVIGFKLLTDAIYSPTHYSSVTYVSPASNTYCYKGQPVYYTQPCNKVWVPGYYTKVPQQIFVNGYYEKRWISPVYDWRWSGCGKRRFKIRNGYYESYWVPGYYRTHYVRNWIPGCWNYY